MNGTWAPAEVQPATRGEFLAARATAVRELERRIGSPLGLVQNSALVFGAFLACTLAGSALSDVRVETFKVVFAVVMVMAALATIPLTIRRALRTRTLVAAVLAWETAERQARRLPPGHVRPDLRMPFDARQDADFEAVARTAEVQIEFRPSAWWLIGRGVPAGMGFALGIASVLGGPVTEPVAQGITFFVSGAYLLICCLVSTVGMLRTGWRLREVWKVHEAEICAWRTERIGPVAAAEVDRAWLRKRWQIASPFIGISLLVLTVKVSTSSPEAVGILVAIVVLGGFITGVVLLFRRLRHRTAPPAEHDLTSVPPG